MILEINDVDFEFLKQVLFKARASLISIGESETYSEDYRRYHRTCVNAMGGDKDGTKH